MCKICSLFYGPSIDLSFLFLLWHDLNDLPLWSVITDRQETTMYT